MKRSTRERRAATSTRFATARSSRPPLTCRRSSRSKPPRCSPMAVVLLPGLLATEAGGQKRLELDAATVGEALRALPVADLVLDEQGEVRSLVHVYVDGERVHDLTAPVEIG